VTQISFVRILPGEKDPSDKKKKTRQTEIQYEKMEITFFLTIYFSQAQRR
jgi:hypothetical protein